MIRSIFQWHVLKNFRNWGAFARIASNFERPLSVFRAIAARRAPQSVTVKSPTGRWTMQLRNFESLKTAFSIFCRHDYLTPTDQPFRFIDVGSNVGVSAIYFLSRHPENRIECYEPDRANLEFLRQNLAQFGERATLHECAVGPNGGSGTLFRSEDGKYTSLVQPDTFISTETVELIPFGDVLAHSRQDATPTVLKLDTEGLEPALFDSVDFSDYPNIKRIIVESLECAQRIKRPHERRVHNGYLEDIRF